MRLDRRILLAALVAQVVILLFYLWPFFSEMFRAASTLGQPLTPALAWAVFLLVFLAISARLWSGPGVENFAISALAHIAALALFHYFIGLLVGRIFLSASLVFLAISLGMGVASLIYWRDLPRPPLSSEPPFVAWDAASVFVLAMLIIPIFFPYIHYDSRFIWACRAFVLGKTPYFSALAVCAQPYSKIAGPTYPPLWSILLWLGIKDPIFQGRLLVWTLLPLFALFFRSRLARLNAFLAPPALLFTLATVYVWDGAATYYADVPLMIFLVTGSLLVLGLPRRESHDRASSAELIAGTLCLSAAVLMRPDGIYYLAVVAGVAAWLRLKKEAYFPAWPFLVAVAVAMSWVLFRPMSLRVAPQYLHPNSLWRVAGTTTVKAVRNIALVFLNGWQGQWFSNRGVGVIFYLLAGLALWNRRQAAVSRGDARFFGLVSLWFIFALMFCFAVIPFVGDPTVACQPGTNYLVSYLLFIRTGLGRMTTHLYPFFVLWGVAVAH